MFDSPYYIIKKWKFWLPIPVQLGLFLPIAYILLPIIMLIPLYLDYKNGEIKEDFILIGIFLIILIIYGFYLLKEAIKIKKVKNYKHNWWWIIKKAKVASIKKTKFNKGKWYKVDVYYFEAEDGNMKYYSNGSTKWVLLGTSIPELELLYTKYWFVFNEKQNQKEDILRVIDEKITETEYEIENSRILSKIIKWKNLWNLKIERKIISDWYIQTYWQIDENKVTIWDTVDVYIDPDNPKRYWVDTDFLF